MTRRILFGLALALCLLAGPALGQDAAQPKTFVYFIAPRDGLMEHPTPADNQAIGAHFQRLQQMLGDGTLILAGPTDPPTVGIVIFTAADLPAAKAWAEADPAVKAGTFTLKSVEAFELALERPSAGVGLKK
jgi:uncharacterized protein YciI